MSVNSLQMQELSSFRQRSYHCYEDLDLSDAALGWRSEGEGPSFCYLLRPHFSLSVHPTSDSDVFLFVGKSISSSSLKKLFLYMCFRVSTNNLLRIHRWATVAIFLYNSPYNKSDICIPH